MQVGAPLLRRVVRQSSTGRSGIVVDSRYDGREVKVKWSEGFEISDWIGSWDFVIAE